MVTGYNEKGSQTIDHYSLLGFTKAYNLAKKSCAQILMNDGVKNIHNLWPLNIGDFHNSDHPQIKEELLNFFKLYEKKLPDGNSQLKDKDHVGNHNLYQSNYDLHNEKSEIVMVTILS